MTAAENPTERSTVTRIGLSGKWVVGLLLLAVALAGVYAIVRIQRSVDESAETSPTRPAPTATATVAPSPDLAPYTLTAGDISRLRAAGLGEPAKEILYDLTNHNDLIPSRGELGGTMLFWPSESRFVGPDRVLAYYEDGHSAGRLLLSFEVMEGEIFWSIEDTLPPPK